MTGQSETGQSETGQSERVRALDRGLAVVEVMAHQGAVTLADLRRATGLANPTLLRLLATLQARGWVRRNLVEGRYELSHGLGAILGGSARAHPLAEIAAPVLLALKDRQARLPSDLAAVRGAGRIEIVESTRLRGPMAPGRTGLGIRPSMVFSAHGRAVLAAAAPEVAARHIAHIRQFARKDEALRLDGSALTEELAATRARGYGLRAKAYWAEPFDEGPEMAAMAVAIVDGTGVHGTISLLWRVQDMALDDVLAEGGLDWLRDAAARVARRLAEAGIAAPEV